MAIEVHLIYTGIVGFVRKDGGITMVMQDASGDPNHPHVPHVVIEDNAYGGSSGLTPLRADTENPADKRLRGYLLKQHQISPTKIASGALSEEMSFGQYVLRLGDSCPPSHPNCGGILRSVLTGAVPAATASRPAVAARQRIELGEIGATWVEPKVAWKYDGPGTPAGRRLAEEVCNSFEIAAGPLRLEFGGGAWLDVKPNPDTIEVRIGNLPDEFLYVRETTWSPEPTDHHVTLYGALSALPVFPPGSRLALKASAVNPPPGPLPQDTHTHRLTPTLTPTLSAESIELVRGPNCPPALWANEA
ncbi:MAG TPA: hypothetical protein VN923_13785 [Thermoanaerobaculia bacterium]|nr:hypothetical protein [Thermoanaerobaculia bacterium]